VIKEICVGVGHVLSLARVSRNVFCKEVVARSAGSLLIVGFDPGACAPGFMLSPAPQAWTRLYAFACFAG